MSVALDLPTAAAASAVLDDPQRASAPAIRTFTRIADRWGLSAQERWRLLGIPKSTYYSYLEKPERARLSHDTLERVSYILGIFKALAILLPRRAAADSWLRRSNAAPVFNGHAPLELMLGGKVASLYLVRRYLDGERGW